MRSGALFFLLLSLPSLLRAEEIAAGNAQIFQRTLTEKVAALEKRNLSAFAGVDGWLFLTNEVRFLAQGRFWGEAALGTSRTRKPDRADPLPAIVDFHRQLQARGIELLLVPVPPKAMIYPEKIDSRIAVTAPAPAPALTEFYGELRARGIDVLDLAPIFAQQREGQRGAVYCRTDSHFSGVGCVLAAEAIAPQIRARLSTLPAGKNYPTEWKQATITGDLAALLPKAGKPAPEQIAVRQLAAAVPPDANSPILLLGDSHTLVFHEFLAERAGLLDQLTAELGFAPDLIGTRGSGATAVRLSLYRRGRSDPQFFARKKIVVWCFAAREFTEADQGWVVQPIAK